MRLQTLSVFAWLACALSGCTATLAVVRIANADKAIHEAQDAGAERLAAYEYALAVEYRNKALEQFSDAQHGDAMELARIAEMTAKGATVKADPGRRAMEEAPKREAEALTDTPAIPPAPPAQPSHPDEPITPSPDDKDSDHDIFGQPDDEPAPWEEDL